LKAIWSQPTQSRSLSLRASEAIDALLGTKRGSPRVVVDTTVQPKNVMFPTDARLLNRAREILVRLAKGAGIKLRQSYARVGKFVLIQPRAQEIGLSAVSSFLRSHRPVYTENLIRVDGMSESLKPAR
jgi:hypothetical protein